MGEKNLTKQRYAELKYGKKDCDFHRNYLFTIIIVSTVIFILLIRKTLFETLFCLNLIREKIISIRTNDSLSL